MTMTFPAPAIEPLPAEASERFPTTIDISNDRRTSFTQIVRAELRKMVDTRSARAVIAAMLLLTVGIPIVMVVITATTDNYFPYSTYLTGAETGLLLLMPALVILMVTSEWSQRAAVTTLTLVPNRGRVMGAKFVAAVVATLAAIGLALGFAAVALLVAGAFDGPTMWDFGWNDLGLFVLSYLSRAVVAFGLATLILNSAGALVSFYLINFALPPMLYGVSGIGKLGSIVEWIDPWAVFSLQAEPSVASNWSHFAVSSLLWAGVPLVIGIRRVLRTEIK